MLCGQILLLLFFFLGIFRYFIFFFYWDQFWGHYSKEVMYYIYYIGHLRVMQYSTYSFSVQ